uniref:Putative head tail connector protein n=1 Tax=viral metagenome TaxID=1070528 RepID=A0A6M3IUB7_9ZZZZ
MLSITTDEVKRWCIEIDQAIKFKEDEFGTNERGSIKGAGQSIPYFEQGYPSILNQRVTDDNRFIPLNVVYPIVKNIVPSLYYKNPNIISVPKRKEDEDSAPYASAILNYYLRELAIKMINQQCIFDGYVLGMGVCKIGYATRFGSDIEDKDLDKNRQKEKVGMLKRALGLLRPKKEEETPQNIELNEYIKSESPYVIWINPFDFYIDPAATSIHDANYCFERVRTNLDKVKNNPNYKNTKDLQGIDLDPTFSKEIPGTQIEKFKPIELYEIHYKSDDGINILVLAKDQGDYVALRHDKSIYDMDGFQYELLSFNKHGHKLYPSSDVDQIKGLQDRVNLTFENVLDQIDKFMSKMIVDETGMTEAGKKALENGNLGAVCYSNKNPNEVVKELTMTQVKGDLMGVIDKMIDVVSLETGVTRAMLTGMTSAETATEAQIGQAGSNLRITDKADLVQDFANNQARKLWQVIRQFVDLEEIELITGDTAMDDVTGTPRYSWLKPVDPDLNQKLIKGEYDFQIEAGSTQKPDLPILRKQIENMANILGQKGVLEAFQMQGYKIELAEIFKRYLQLFPDVFTNVGRIIKPIQPGTPGLIQPQQPGQPGQSGGGMPTPNMPNQMREPPVNMADIISEIGGEKGQMGGLA